MRFLNIFNKHKQILNALNSHQIEKVIKLLDSGVEVDPALYHRILGAGVTHNHPHLIETVIGKDADLNTVEFQPEPHIHKAVRTGCAEKIIRLFIEAGADPNLKYDTGDGQYVSLLQQAATSGKVKTVKLLLKAGANPNEANTDRQTVDNQEIRRCIDAFREELNKNGKTEEDNIGSRKETKGDGIGYLSAYPLKGAEPIIFYSFDSEDKAIRAMLEIPCIELAADSNKMVCSEVLDFGVFPTVEDDDTETWGALLAGKSLDYLTWQTAKDAIEKHGGRQRKIRAPLKTTVIAGNHNADPDAVIKTHERNEVVAGAPATYIHYTAPNRASAIAWLKQHPIDKPSYFLVVETPEGVISRDFQGFFES